jgi:hypothetical protein
MPHHHILAQAFLRELDLLYCDVIMQHYEQFTGQKAERHG